ncbi:hypothetical protein SRB5_42250 [Streptomyces sp. RB5]|uniref:SWIM-type domain-containing protein n=1 Tax=Streptomyces smaragdinus TaxID=2585196 RepID=A0A7K0CMR4_9ACTN|nr:hypothetical protein [Streptomyces smaragdinus]MQY14064.1 hypothetical protein [Streptomyces smaragdinus]
MTLPAVPPHVTAELVEALSPRLRKRLDAAAAKLLARPLRTEGDLVRIELDESTVLELRAPGGRVTAAEAIRCSCLLAPGCVHRAAIAGAAPVAEEEEPPGEAEDATAAPAAEPASVEVPDPAAVDALWSAGAAVLEAGVDGAGAVLQAELLRAAHTARLAALPGPAAAAVRIVNQLRAARAADPDHRLADLTDALRELLTAAHLLRRDPTARDHRGTARRAYTPGGSLRLYGLFTEPVLASTGHAGAVTWTADADGRLYSVPDVAPGTLARATGAAGRAIRMGDTALTHRELSRAGLAVSGATVSADGRLGAGKGVQAVRAAGADWTEAPLDRLWTVPPAEQVDRALAAPDGPGLLFLDVTLTGAVRETGGDSLLADCAGVPLRLTAAHEHPGLAYRDNLKLLATAPGTALRIIARLVRADHPRAQLLAVRREDGREGGREGGREDAPAARHDLGLDRLQRTDVPPPPDVHLPLQPPAAPAAPVHVLRRRTEQAVSAGRRALALPGGADDTRALRRAGLVTAAELLAGLRGAAADRGRDHFGRLLPADGGQFARAWLGAALYSEEAARRLCRTAWLGGAGDTREYGG